MPPEVRENERKLAACDAPHDFVHVQPQPGERPTRAVFQCAKCGGRVRGDGSVGAWAARFVSEYGVVERGVVGRHDLRKYDEVLCREFGRLGARDLAAWIGPSVCGSCYEVPEDMMHAMAQVLPEAASRTPRGSLPAIPPRRRWRPRGAPPSARSRPR